MRVELVVNQVFSADPDKRFWLKCSDFFLKLETGSLLESLLFSLVISHLFHENKILINLICIAND